MLNTNYYKTKAEIVFPWNVDPRAEKWQWAVAHSTDRGIPDRIWSPVDRSLADQVGKLMEFSLGKRNWILCLSMSPSYMRTLYLYLEASWACSTNDTFEEVTAQDIVQLAFTKDMARIEELHQVGLLVIPYFEPSYVGVQKAGSMFSSVLLHRKTRGFPTIMDVMVKNRPTSEAQAIQESKRLVDIFGTTVSNVFADNTARIVSVSVPTQ